jgi:hypothetical protein
MSLVVHIEVATRNAEHCALLKAIYDGTVNIYQDAP